MDKELRLLIKESINKAGLDNDSIIEPIARTFDNIIGRENSVYVAEILIKGLQNFIDSSNEE